MRPRYLAAGTSRHARKMRFSHLMPCPNGSAIRIVAAEKPLPQRTKRYSKRRLYSNQAWHLPARGSVFLRAPRTGARRRRW
jgi:hypothetical protein